MTRAHSAPLLLLAENIPGVRGQRPRRVGLRSKPKPFAHSIRGLSPAASP